MSEWFLSLGPVEWFREQFEGCPEDALNCDSISAQELVRFVLIAWLVAAVVLIALDRLGNGLWGRSRPLAQEPPTLARSWRWGRKTPPANYSLLPPGTTIPSVAPTLPETTPTERPSLPALPAATTAPGQTATITLLSPGSELADSAYWNTFAGSASPIFGHENDDCLKRGKSPERYNPIRGRVETLRRDRDAAELRWEWTPESVATVGFDDTGEEE